MLPHSEAGPVSQPASDGARNVRCRDADKKPAGGRMNPAHFVTSDDVAEIRLTLNLHHLLRLQTLGALLHLKLDELAFVQGLVSIHLNGGEVNEYVLSRLALNETIPLRSVEPLDHTLFSIQGSHSCS
jgi:hypothetical protein